MSTAPQIPVWTWRDAVRQTAVPPLTKLVCYSIANYLADVGQGCFPSIRTLIADTGLSNRSLATHIRGAVAAGLLVVERKTGRDGRYQLTRYLPRFPDNATLARRPAEGVAAAADAVAEVDDGHSVDPEIQVKQLHVDADQVKQLHADRPSEAASRGEAPPRELHRVNLVTTGTIHRGNYKNPLIPSEAGESRVDKFREKLLADLVAWGRHRSAVDGLIAPLIAARRFSAQDPAAALRQIAERAAPLSKPRLDKVLAMLLDLRDGKGLAIKTIKAARVLDAIDAVKAGGLMLVVDRRETPQQWAAWLRHWQATMPPGMARKIEQAGRWQAPDEWPPGATRQTGPRADLQTGPGAVGEAVALGSEEGQQS